MNESSLLKQIIHERALNNTCWFVGSYYEGEYNKDYTEEFVCKGVWENFWVDKYLDIIKEIQPGQYIALKSTYTRKIDGKSTSVMAIKAVGVVTKNLGDGRHLELAWCKLPEKREWYHYTYLGTIWKVEPINWQKIALIRFTFNAEPQNMAKFHHK